MPTDLPEGYAALDARDRAKRYRDARKAAGTPARSGKSGKSGKGGKKPSLFSSGEFVAIDGEGFSEGPERVFTVGTNNAQYKGRDHFYALLAASDGSEVYEPRGRLSTEQCLNFVLDIAIANPRAIIVCFGGGYDICQFLAHGLTREQAKELMTEPDPDNPADKRRRQTLDCSFGEYDYRLEYRPRKSLNVWRWSKGAEKYERYHKKDGTPAWRMTDHVRAVVWDVWGFFQDSFTGVMKKWIPDDPDYQFIVKNKGSRNVFERSEIDTIRRYNQAELRCLVEIMNKLRSAISDLGLQITRWDGAGAIAASMLKHHEVKDHKNVTPDPVFLAARHAYSGGHIEVFQMGFHDGCIYHYDVNSAYPDQFRNLPSLAAGRWISGTGTPPDGFTLVRVAYECNDGCSFYPLFYREEDGTIFYPRRGQGWYWYAEFEAAREFAGRFGAVRFDVIEWHHFQPHGAGVYPFRWVEDYYAERQRRTADAKRRGVEDGPEKIIKLGLNSLYGKTAQQVGARENEDGETVAPPYFQLEWSGYVTAGCRAKLMQAAIQNPTAIIGMATDGLFSTEALDLDCPREKILGAWEFQQHDGMTMVMPGVYWLHEAGQKPKHYSRGFDKAQMSDAEFIHRAWKWRLDSVPIDITRLIGLGTAITGDSFWAMRGMFVSASRDLALNGHNSKRYPVTLSSAKPHTRLVPTRPRDHDMDLFTATDDLMSAAYDIDWLEDKPDTPKEFDVSDYEDDWEMDDADLA